MFLRQIVLIAVLLTLVTAIPVETAADETWPLDPSDVPAVGEPCVNIDPSATPPVAVYEC